VALKFIGYLKSAADPCLHLSWTMTGLVIWLTQNDDCLIVGDEKGVKTKKEQIKSRFDCDDVGILNAYVGCKIRSDKNSIRFIKLVLLQSFEDEFKCKAGKVMVPAEAEGVLIKNRHQEKALSKGEQIHYRSEVGRLLHMMCWSRLETYNAVRDLSRYMMTTQEHVKVMEQVMNYCLSTREIGLELRPEEERTGNLEFKLKIWEDVTLIM